MATKKPYVIRAMQPNEVTALNENIDRLYAYKLESLFKTEASSTQARAFVYQQMEHGECYFSANGSATVVRTFPLKDTHATVIYANAHAMHTGIAAAVTDVTATSITITARTISGTANFSAVTTATVRVFWQVVGSSP